MLKHLRFKILTVFWALALIVVGIIYYKNNKSCSNCQANTSPYSALTESQQEKVEKHKAVLLFPDNADPIYVDLDTVYSRHDITTFSTAQPDPLSQDEIEHILNRMLYSKYVRKMPVEYRPLLSQRKLAVLQSKDGNFFIVALRKYIVENN